MNGDRITQRSISAESQIVWRIYSEAMCEECFTVESTQSQSECCLVCLRRVIEGEDSEESDGVERIIRDKS